MDKLVLLYESTGIYNIEAGQVIMALVCLTFIYLGIKKEFEPLLLIPIGFGGLMVNVPLADIGGPDGFLGIILLTKRALSLASYSSLSSSSTDHDRFFLIMSMSSLEVISNR